VHLLRANLLETMIVAGAHALASIRCGTCPLLAAIARVLGFFAVFLTKQGVCADRVSVNVNEG
jgi:hypothetical protein